MATQNYISDELTHFVGRALQTDEERFRVFLEILEYRWLRASYREKFGAGFTVRSAGGKELSSNDCVVSTTLCFCDIPESEMAIHVSKYGPFGIAFPKAFLLRHGASPVFYVARNASTSNLEPGIGARMLGERFDELHREMAEVLGAFNDFVWEREPASLARVPGLRVTFEHSPEGTPKGQQALGKLSSFCSDLDKLVFSYLKFFTAELPYEHADNYYMEREWRKRDGLAFDVENVARLYVPPHFREQLLARHPEYSGKLGTV
ncbi:MAG: abortive infection system antitoxin AbiGi family protein [Bryobacteraceae bacterium]